MNIIQVKVYAQDPVMDSLKLALKNAKHDTTRCNILLKLIDEEEDDNVWTIYNDKLLKITEKNSKYQSDYKSFYLELLSEAYNNIGFLASNKGDNSKAIEYYNKSLKIKEEIFDKQGIAVLYINIGTYYETVGNVNEAIKSYMKSLSIYTEIKDKEGISTALNNIGLFYDYQGDILKALEYYHKSLKIREEINDQSGIASSLNNIGAVYSAQGDILKALEYTNRSLIIREHIEDKAGMARSLNHLAAIYKNQGDVINALTFAEKSLKINEELDYKGGIANSLNNIGDIYSKLGDPTVKSSKRDCMMKGQIKALQYFYRSLMLRESVNDKVGIATVLNDISVTLFKQKNDKEALKYATKSLKAAKELGYPENIKNASSILKNVYKKHNKYKEAFEMFELEIQMRDSISNEETKKASIKKQFQYEYEKQAAADSVKHTEEQKVKNAQLQAQAASLKQEKTQRYALYGGLFLVIGFSVFVFNRFKVTQKQKKVIEEQKVLVDSAYESLHEKNKEVMDSITYARRIQRALITPEAYIDKVLTKLNKNS